MSSRAVRDGRSAPISSAWAWWPMMPCMNFTSASAYLVMAGGGGGHDAAGLARRAGLHDARSRLTCPRSRRRASNRRQDDSDDAKPHVFKDYMPAHAGWNTIGPAEGGQL